MALGSVAEKRFISVCSSSTCVTLLIKVESGSVSYYLPLQESLETVHLGIRIISSIVERATCNTISLLVNTTRSNILTNTI